MYGDRLDGQSEFDQRALYMKRLNDACIACHLSMMNNNLDGWYKALLMLKVELSAHTDEPEKSDLKKKFRLLEIYRKKTGKFLPYHLFAETQETLYSVMRKKSLDVPIKTVTGDL